LFADAEAHGFTRAPLSAEVGAELRSWVLRIWTRGAEPRIAYI